MRASREFVEGFYRAFSERDHAAMGACYADDAVFSDPVFPRLEGPRVRAMWRMLCERGKDLELTFGDVHVDGERGSAHWEARYTFSATGRPVHNVIDASFGFRDGLIVAHRDVFSLWRWSSMALGWPGRLLGWTPLLRAKIRRRSAAALDAFIASRGLDA